MVVAVGEHAGVDDGGGLVAAVGPTAKVVDGAGFSEQLGELLRGEAFVQIRPAPQDGDRLVHLALLSEHLGQLVQRACAAHVGVLPKLVHVTTLAQVLSEMASRERLTGHPELAEHGRGPATLTALGEILKEPEPAAAPTRAAGSPVAKTSLARPAISGEERVRASGPLGAPFISAKTNSHNGRRFGDGSVRKSMASVTSRGSIRITAARGSTPTISSARRYSRSRQVMTTGRSPAA
ncbi:hypothetical protein [Paractinoplanes atraurantiacus]|uniref:Uncharacterized protein n=1 Tax=Paractinoplanes atraurantiacus TaxID=1036182 RepID=A0A285KI57_9ACTN|nr:hypothetical protein [Actinoplanes atraurantiacus]SNY71587.1 hypothetical protein SAMN05421748_14060 [Actinoplanes atraurantiacus]